MSVELMTPIEKAIDMYYLGDSIGAMAEGGAGGSCSLERAMTGLRAFLHGTDESDTVHLFQAFSLYYHPGMKSQTDILTWHCYHTERHRLSSYGKTWRDHFATVKAMDKKSELSILGLLAISADRNSFGNGLLALVFPVMMHNVKRDIYQILFSTTHYQAAPTCGLMVEALRNRDLKMIEEIIEPVAHVWRDSPGMTPHYLYCIAAAYEVAKQPTIKEAIEFALAFGGDVDSYLSFGLLMWAWLGDLLGDRNSEKQVDEFIRVCLSSNGNEVYQRLISTCNV